MTPLDGKRLGLLALLALAGAGGATAVLLAGDDPGADGQAPVAGNASPAPEPQAQGGTREGEARPHDPGRRSEQGREDGRSRLEEAIGPSQRPSGAAERGAVRAVEAYVDALDRRDGEVVCRLLAPGALEGLELPRAGAGCAGSLEASIGYRHPRGSPVWEGAEIEAIQSASADGGEARVVVTVITRFADRSGVSVEDDVVYLQRNGGGWLVAKPSATLYRAVGFPDVPPSAFAPPQGRETAG